MLGIYSISISLIADHYYLLSICEKMRCREVKWLCQGYKGHAEVSIRIQGL